ncbi:MAG TPA: PA14 domain-containing protein [Kofleriaceae bacterium]|nr:PA14 domain-containing protein [Kofleriaceae bacterium]
MTPAARALAVERARDELRAVHALLDRPELAGEAMVPLERAGRIATRLGIEAPEGSAVERARALASALDRVEPAMARDRRVRRWIVRVAVAVALLATIVIVAKPAADRTPADGPWRAQYFKNRHFHGEPSVTRDPDVNMDWGDGIPRFGFPYDNFSVRWHACLVVPAATTMTLAATSHDGSRVLIDGEIVVDNWGEHELRTVREQIEFAAGTHLIEVRYTTNRGPSGVALHAATGDHPLAPLPPSLLRLPSPTNRCN